MALEDRTLLCRNCGKDFIFTGGEQAFFLRRGLLNDPLRCPLCRAEKRKERGESNQKMTAVVCASCGGEAIVPFIPRLDKPVYCNFCFEKMRPTV